MNSNNSNSDMVLIPGSEFKMGKKGGGRLTSPEQTIMVESFYMDIYPVTNDEYSKVITDWKFDAEKKDYPVVGLPYEKILEYCRQAGKRLPTEAEWEKAARGDQDARLYPWGDVFSTKKCNSKRFFFMIKRRSAPVNSYEDGRSPFGCFDMIGNVWEWTSTNVDEERYILKGGSCFSPSKRHLTIPSRLVAHRNSINYTFGFRCCREGDT